MEMEMETTTSNKINTSIHEYGCHKYDKHANLTTLILKHISLHSHPKYFKKGNARIHMCKFVVSNGNANGTTANNAVATKKKRTKKSELNANNRVPTLCVSVRLWFGIHQI